MAGRPKAIVLLSGGIDSAVALHWSIRQGHAVVPLTFDYHLRPSREIEAIEALLDHARSAGPPGSFGSVEPLQRVAVPFLREVEDMAQPSARLNGAPEGYIPARNLVFYGIAASLAEREDARFLVGGHNGIDPELFPDASPQFFGSFNDLLRNGVWSYAKGPIEVVLPIAGKTKAEVLRMGFAWGVPFERTWSCYGDDKAHCGACGSCQERREAFAALGRLDPATYLEAP